MNQFWVKDLFQSHNHNFIRSVFNRLRHFRRQSIDHTLSFAYVNDPALAFGMMNVYVDIAKECEALRRHGLVSARRLAIPSRPKAMIVTTTGFISSRSEIEIR